MESLDELTRSLDRLAYFHCEENFTMTGLQPTKMVWNKSKLNTSGEYDSMKALRPLRWVRWPWHDDDSIN